MAVIPIENFGKFMVSFEKEMNELGVSIPQVFAKSLQRGIRLRAPSNYTGSLKETIIRKYGRNLQLLAPAHWEVVEKGLFPKHPIPIEYFEAHMGSPGSTVGMRAKIKNPKAWFQPKPSEAKGFITESMNTLEKDAPRLIEMEVAKAFARLG